MRKIKIVNPELYEKIISSEDMWRALFQDEEGTLEDERVPLLQGGLDHIEVTKKAVTFHDRGVSTNDGKYRDTTFAILK